MPDGSMVLTRRVGAPKKVEIPAAFLDPAIEAMHKRLVKWGLCWLRGGGGVDQFIVRQELVQVTPGDPNDPENSKVVPSAYSDPDPDRKPREWSRPEIDAAGRLHSRIIRLPLVAHRLTLQVFYAETCAEIWGSVLPDAKFKIIRDLTTWQTQPYGANARLSRYSREMQDPQAPIRPDDFMAVMLRGMRILVASERMLP